MNITRTNILSRTQDSENVMYFSSGIIGAAQVVMHLLHKFITGKGYFVNTVGQHGTENEIAKYVKDQGIEKEYKALKKDYQLKLF